MGILLTRVARGTVLTHVRHVTPVAPRVANGLVGRVYRQVERDFGMLAPPVALHSPAPDALAACWLMLRETLVAAGPAGRTAKEVVAAAVSAANACPYCVQVHGSALVGLFPGLDSAAGAADRIAEVAEPALGDVARWARGTGDHAAGRPIPFPRSQAPELIGVAVTFHYLNRMVNVFLQDSPLPAVPARARRGLERVAARIMGGLARRRRRPGESLDLLPAAPSPVEFRWAGGTVIADALARASAAIEAGGARAVPDQVRSLVLARLADRAGATPGISARAWTEEAVAGLPDRERPAGRLAMLTAFASYQVTDSVIRDFRRLHPRDDTLVELTAWASLAAARRIGARLAGDPGPVGASG